MSHHLAAFLLGIVEGITEFLPISSTGHLLIAEHWVPRQSDLFNTVIQSVTVLAVLFIFLDRIKGMLTGENREEFKLLFISFFVTGVGGVILKKMGLKLPEALAPVAWATLIGGILFIFVEKIIARTKKNAAIDFRIAVILGVAQLIAAIFPGASRSGVTIIMAMLLGVDRKRATEFSFLLGVPTLMAAGALETYKAVKLEGVHSIDWSVLGIGSLTALVVAFFSVRWLLRYIETHNYNVFGWYRIALGVALLVHLAI